MGDAFFLKKFNLIILTQRKENKCHRQNRYWQIISQGLIFAAEMVMTSTAKTILYLEDDEFTRLMVQAQLENSGFSVRSFSQYSELSEALGHIRPDLVIADLNIDGYSPKELINNLKKQSTAPIIALTASDGHKSTADLTIIKPLTTDKIEQIWDFISSNNIDIDLSKVYQFACGDDELLHNYVTTFVENFAKDLQAFKTEVDASDITGIKNRAHKMLSSVAYYSHKPLNSLLQKLENEAEGLTQSQLKTKYYQIKMLSDHLLNNVREKILS